MILRDSKSSEQTQVLLASTGAIVYGTFIAIDVDPFQTIGLNTFSLGFQIDYPWEWEEFKDRPTQLQLAQDANFKLIRVFERHWGPLDYSEGVGPCRYWDESTKTGTFDWSDVDSVVQAIYSTGVEPLICLSAWSGRKPTVPQGRVTDPSTLLPYSESYARAKGQSK